MNRNHRNPYALHLVPMTDDRAAVLARLANVRAMLATRRQQRAERRRAIAWVVALAAAAVANVVAVML